MAVAFDADSILQRMIDRLKAKSEWQDVLFFSNNQTLLQVVAESIADTANYDEYLTRENKWTVARNISSIRTQSNILDYESKRTISATGQVKISASETFDSPPVKTIEIPKYTRFSSDTNIDFISDNSYNITPSDNFINVGVIQGRSIEVDLTANGDINEEVTITNSNIENGNIEVYINSMLWTETKNLVSNESTDEVYEILNEFDLSGIIIRFGDNIFGKKLNNGDLIKVSYIESDGVEGEIISTGSITNVNSPIFNIDSERVDVFVTNEEAIIGGKVPEDIDQIRNNAVESFQSGDRVVSPTDYINFIENFSFVSKSNAWGVYETNIDDNQDPWNFIPFDENKVFLTTLTTSFQNLNQTQIDEISVAINEKKSPTDILSFETVEIIDVIFVVSAKIQDRTFTLSAVKSEIDTALTNEYDIENMNFNQNIFFSDYQCLIDQVPGVSYHDTTSKIFMTTQFQSQYSLNTTLPIFKIKESSVKIYTESINTLVRNLTAIDDGTGNLIAQAGFTLNTGSVVTYETGGLIISIASGLSETFDQYNIYIEYETENTNLILQNRKQIFNYNSTESSIDVQYTGA